MNKTLIILIGPHAVGKMTVGQELEKRTGIKLFHNHHSIELARKLFDYSDAGFYVLNRTIRETVFDIFSKGDYKGLIFTYMVDFDTQDEFEYLNGIINRFESNGANCYVVELCADFDVRIERNKSENRLLNKESKRNIELSEAEMRNTSRKYRLNSYDNEELPFKQYLKIDNTSLSAECVADMIIKRFGI